MDELVMSPETLSTVVSALDEHTDLDALLGAILADTGARQSLSADLAARTATPARPPVSVPVAAMAAAVQDVAAAPRHQAVPVSVTVSRVEAPRLPEDDLGARLDARLRPTERRPAPEPERMGEVLVPADHAPLPEPSLDAIDAFLDARMRHNGGPGWSTFAPAPTDGQSVNVSASGHVGPSRLGSAVRRVAAAAAALGLGVLVIWTVLR